MQGFAARILLAFGLAAIVCEPSPAQNFRSLWDASLLLRAGPQGGDPLFSKQVITPEDCEDLCFERGDCTVWKWRNSTAGSEALQCRLYSGFDIRSQPSEGKGYSGVFENRVASARHLASQQQSQKAKAPRDDNTICAESFDGNEIVEACTRLIVSGKYTGRNAAILYGNRAVGYNILKNFDSAMTDVNQSLRIDSSYYKAYSIRGDIHFERNNYTQADANYSECIRLNPKFAFAYSRRGVVRNRQQRYDLAFSDLSEAIRLSPEAAPLIREGQRALLKGIRSNQDLRDYGYLSTAYFIRGGIYFYQKNDKDRAVQDIAMAAALGDEDAFLTLKEMKIIP